MKDLDGDGDGFDDTPEGDAGVYDDVPEHDGPAVAYVDAPAQQKWPGRTRRASDYGHSRYVYRQLRARFKRICQDENRACWQCGCEIDYTSPHGSNPRCFEVDHRRSPLDHPEDELDITTWEACCSLCNRRRGRGEPVGASAPVTAGRGVASAEHGPVWPGGDHPRVDPATGRQYWHPELGYNSENWWDAEGPVIFYDGDGWPIANC